MFMFASILEHADREQQLSDRDLERLFNGDECFRDYKMGYPRFILFGNASDGYFKPDQMEEDDVPGWHDELFTACSYEEYWKMSPAERERNGLPIKRECKRFGFRLSGIASTSGITLTSHCNSHTSSEPTYDQMKHANKIGHLTPVPAIDIVVVGLGAKCTDRDVQASSVHPMDHPDIHGGKRFGTDRELVYVVFDIGSLLEEKHDTRDNKRRRVRGKRLRGQANGHYVVAEAPDPDDIHKKDHFVPDRLISKVEVTMSYLIKTGGDSREPIASEKTKGGSNRGPIDSGATPETVSRERPTVIYAIPDLASLIPMGYVRVNIPAAYARQECGLVSHSFEPLFVS